MKTTIKDKVIELHLEGTEPTEIANQMYPEASVASVYRWIKEWDNENAPSGEAVAIPLSGSDSAYDEQDEDTSHKPSNRLTVNDTTSTLGLKRKVLKHFIKTFKELRANAEGGTWKHKQLKVTLATLESLQDDVESILNYEQDDFANNALWLGLDEYIDLFQDWVIAGGSIELELSTNNLNTLDYYIGLTDFDTEYDFEREFKSQLAGVAKTVLALDGSKLDEEEVQELIEELDGLEGLHGDYGLSGTDCSVKPLHKLQKEIKRFSKEASDSFWGSAKLKLKKNVKGSLKGIIEEEVNK